ncbi:MAG: hypothetical protein VXW65_00355 [Pseudomonadota bacterium]|nr:hypothetical protein [Pseudomonadota bacterium]
MSSQCSPCSHLPPLYLGDMFKVVCQYTDSADQPKSLADVEIKSQFRNPYTKQKIADLTIVIVDEALGIYEVRYSDTYAPSFLNLDHLIWNIRYTYLLEPESTENIRIDLVEGATHDND